MPTPIKVYLGKYAGTTAAMSVQLQFEGTVLNPTKTTVTESANGYFTGSTTEDVTAAKANAIVFADSTPVWEGWKWNDSDWLSATDKFSEAVVDPWSLSQSAGGYTSDQFGWLLDSRISDIELKVASTPIAYYTAQPDPSLLKLVRGDSYEDSDDWGPLEWRVADTNPWSATPNVEFTIRDMDDNIMLDHTTPGVDVTATFTGTERVATVKLSDDATNLLMVTCNAKFDCRFVATDGAFRQSAGSGECMIKEDQSRF